MKRLEYRKVTMRFAGAKGATFTAIEDVDFSVADGEVVSLIGPSGCGKSTLLNIGSGLYSPSLGEAYVDGERVEGPNDHVAFMLQKDLLLPWRTIEQNVMLGTEIRKLDGTESRRKARELLQAFKLGEFAERYPHQLSGGMRQRAALARTLAVDPSVLLLDEPFSALDDETRQATRALVEDLTGRHDWITLLVSHYADDIAALATRVYRIEEGRLLLG